ncbi:hypothetical protein FA15DRAFT_661972 [Coprinopsis marcescibilis]|uniref:Uncharacterized protein n=1 Tax=Coprinopsis marcescibilis TaxID=230819 RepID=A0A5C3K9Y3_COPMA|nr:hypothetical protein FA15DRAFT_661972 [Coprinopsis marcescibilis]
MPKDTSIQKLTNTVTGTSSTPRASDRQCQPAHKVLETISGNRQNFPYPNCDSVQSAGENVSASAKISKKKEDNTKDNLQNMIDKLKASESKGTTFQGYVRVASYLKYGKKKTVKAWNKERLQQNDGINEEHLGTNILPCIRQAAGRGLQQVRDGHYKELKLTLTLQHLGLKLQNMLSPGIPLLPISLHGFQNNFACNDTQVATQIVENNAVPLVTYMAKFLCSSSL